MYGCQERPPELSRSAKGQKNLTMTAYGRTIAKLHEPLVSSNLSSLNPVRILTRTPMNWKEGGSETSKTLCRFSQDVNQECQSMALQTDRRNGAYATGNTAPATFGTSRALLCMLTNNS